jgi:hypothetical protein
MLDPIGGFHRIRDLYITYLETNFRIRDPKLDFVHLRLRKGKQGKLRLDSS